VGRVLFLYTGRQALAHKPGGLGSEEAKAHHSWRPACQLAQTLVGELSATMSPEGEKPRR
jgi:hypothetical protein